MTFAMTILAGLCGALQPHAAAVEVRIPRQPGIPPAAEEVLAGFEAQANAILAKSQAEMTARRVQAVARLQALLQARMQAADLDGALAIRQMIRSLESAGGQFTLTRSLDLNSPVPQPGTQAHPAYPAMPPPTTATPPALSLTKTILTRAGPLNAIGPDPGDLTAYSARIGDRLYFSVRGDQGGSGGVWGTGLYTHDSTLAQAAVHAGALQAGEQGIVLVTILKGPTWFQGSTRNGITAGDWYNADGSYSAYMVQRVPPRAAYVAPRKTVGFTYGYAPLLRDPGTMTPHYQSVGQSFLIDVTGNDDGPVWGTDCYTYDSDLSSAAVHAGVVRLGRRSVVRVTIEKGPARFVGSMRNGVSTHDWDNSGGHYTAFRIQAADVPGLSITPTPTGDHVLVRSMDSGGTVLSTGTLNVLPNPGGTLTFSQPLPPVPLPDPGNLLAFRGLNGREFYFRVTGRAGVDFAVWGTDVYTDDSFLAMAAVHAGALRVGEAGLLKVTILPGRDSYSGSSRNGVRTDSYPAFGGSYRVERAPEDPVEDTSILLEAETLNLSGATIKIGGITGSGGRPVRDTPTGTIDISGSTEIEVSGDTDMQLVNPGPGRVYYLQIKGRTDGRLWGSDVYTSDSSVGTAAVHAGVLKPGETGVVKVTIAPGQDSYEGSTRNDITSSSYQSWDVSYQVEKNDR